MMREVQTVQRLRGERQKKERWKNSANIEQNDGIMGKQICRINNEKWCKNKQKMSEKQAKVFCRRSTQNSAKIKQNVWVMDKFVGETGKIVQEP